MKKLLIWDADDTLWDGTLVEGKVSLPEGRFELCQELYDRGVIQSIASHNLLNDVEGQLHKFGLSQFFVLPQASFNSSKVSMIEFIVSELGLSRMSDVAFVDDNKWNRIEIIDALPDVLVAAPEDLDMVIDNHFTKEHYTDEDRLRVRMYQSELARKASAQSHSGSKIEFLRTLNLKVDIRKADESDLPRIYDLVRRANKLSAAARLYDENDLRLNLSNLVVLRAEDKYGSYGLSGVILLEGNIIKLLTISCRLQGKGLGSAFLGSIINSISVSDRIQAMWIPTDYNSGIDSLYGWYGFMLADIPPHRIAELIIEAPAELPDWIEVRHEL